MAIIIKGAGCLSPAGKNLNENWQSHLAGKPCVDSINGTVAGILPASIENDLQQLQSIKPYKSYDKAAAMGILASREAVHQAGLKDFENFGIIFGSSRGATRKWESEFGSFQQTGKVSVHASPTTTMGTFAAVLAQEFQTTGLSLSVSSACSTGLHATGIAASLIKSGQIKGAITGGSESSCTPFTFEQLKTVKVYQKQVGNPEMPYRPFHEDSDGIVIGEGSAAIVLCEEDPKPGDVEIIGYGAATEAASATGIDKSGALLEQAIRQATVQAKIDLNEIDCVIAHGSGTTKGDQAEKNLYQRLLDKRTSIWCHKWLTGHLLGASSAYSIVIASEILKQNTLPAIPYLPAIQKLQSPLRIILVSALGFGGNAGALLLRLRS